jgi:hypothetical protein
LPTKWIVAEVISSPGHLGEVLEALGADDHLLIRLEARLSTLRQRFVAREPPGWFGLEYLVEEAKSLHRNTPELDGVHMVLDTERLGSTEITDRIRSSRPDKLSRGESKVG